MKSPDSSFFPKGGFLSSHFDDTKITDDANGMNSLYPIDIIQNDMIVNQIKSRRNCQKSKWDFST